MRDRAATCILERKKQGKHWKKEKREKINHKAVFFSSSSSSSSSYSYIRKKERKIRTLKNS